MKRAQTWTLQEENDAGKEKDLRSQRNVFLCEKNKKATTLKYIDPSTSAVCQFRRVKNCLKMAK
jgi:hypothetical protein